MSEFISPVPTGYDPEPAEVYREIYPMPMFTFSPASDLEASRDFWVEGLGFIDLFSIPGEVTHLRRWAFQDVLLVPGQESSGDPAMSVYFSCVIRQIAEIQERCEKLVPGCTDGPRLMPWNSVELTILTPEKTRVVMSAAQPIDPDSQLAEELRESGFQVPDR